MNRSHWRLFGWGLAILPLWFALCQLFPVYLRSNIPAWLAFWCAMGLAILTGFLVVAVLAFVMAALEAWRETESFEAWAARADWYTESDVAHE